MQNFKNFLSHGHKHSIIHRVSVLGGVRYPVSPVSRFTHRDYPVEHLAADALYKIPDPLSGIHTQGDIAQLGERLNGIQEVTSSSLAISIHKKGTGNGMDRQSLFA